MCCCHADVVVVFRGTLSSFLLLQAACWFAWPCLAWIHLPAVAWGAGIEFAGGICPLTPLENYLRRLGGESTYSGDFVMQYLLPVIYPENLTITTQYILGVLVIVINLIVYGMVIHRLYRR